MLRPSDGWPRDTAGQALTACPPLLRHAEQRGMDARGKELCCAWGIGACCFWTSPQAAGGLGRAIVGAGFAQGAPG